MKQKTFKPVIWLLIILILISYRSLAQSDGTPVSSSDIRKELDAIYGADTRLVSGLFYHNPPKGPVAGHPFCIDEEWKNGSVTLNGRLYDDLLLRYDVEDNELVLNTSKLNGKSLQICLNTEEISSFEMDGRKFVVFPSGKDEDKPVFCELATDGEIDFLIVRKKEIRIINSGGNTFEYKEYYDNYLLKDGELHKFRNRRSLFRLVPSIKKDLRRYANMQGLSPGRKNVEDRALLVNKCNNLLSEQ